MGRLTVIALLLVLALGMTLAAVITVAPADDSYSPLINTLRRPPPGCELPCWHDLILNVTTFEQTKAIISADPAFDQVDINPNGPIVAGFHDQPDTNRVEITFNSQHTVATIGIIGKEPVGHILNLFGSPSHFSSYESCYSKALDLFYPIATVYLHAPDVPRLSSQVDLEVVLTAPGNSPPADSFAVWRGFTARYFWLPSPMEC
ncbi:MAG: hypothetical protein ACYDBJ_18845 [Aggregatilineales bacterium]